MTKELMEEYKNLFILCLETAGNETGDEMLLNVERLLNNSVADEIINTMGLESLTAKDLSTIFLSSILTPKELQGRGGPSLDTIKNLPSIITSLSKKAEDLYEKYLYDATEQFCKKHGISNKVSNPSTILNGKKF